MTAITDDPSLSTPGTSLPATAPERQAWALATLLLETIARAAFAVPDAEGHTPPGAAGLTHGETRVLHYLPTNLSAREIACELCLSVNTIKTHQRHLYQKLGASNRSQAVDNARALGLLAPSLRKR